ncbi:MAG: DUF5615 family PIN-like protein [Thermomicrobiales bacterium]
MTKFLLDANLSPKVARFLFDHFQLDVISLQGQRLGELPDKEVIRMARRTRRVIITLDRDFAEYFYRVEQPTIGIISLDLPNTHRNNPGINRVRADFFESHSSTIDLDLARVILTEQTVRIVRPRLDVFDS